VFKLWLNNKVGRPNMKWLDRITRCADFSLRMRISAIFLLPAKVRANAFVILPNAFWTVVLIEKIKSAFRTRSFRCIALCETR